MNCRIVGSGNTPLHVAAINDQSDCARILLLRGCDTAVVNNSHQNAHQVAVISGNMSMAHMIINHKPENVVQYRDKPRFNPARRPQNYCDTTGRGNNSVNMNGSNGTHLTVRPSSPSLSLNTNNTTTSSGVCCEDEDEMFKKNQQIRKYENNNGNQDDGGENDDVNVDELEDKVEDNSSSEDSVTFLPGITVKAVSDYNSGDPSHLQLRRNDYIYLLQSTHSPPTIASQKLLLGRRCADGKEGFFPACCVEKIKRAKHYSHNGDEYADRVEGRRDMKLKSSQSATLPSRGRRGARKFFLCKVFHFI